MNKIWRLFLGLFFFMLSHYGNVFGQTATIDSLKKSLNNIASDVDALKNLKAGGWIQAQFQMTETKGAKTFDGGDFMTNSNSRFMIRRGRIKFTYTKGLGQYVIQINATERGINLVDFYGKLTVPWEKSLALTVGVMNRPFGFEIQQSSQERETPERSRFTQILLPNERDLGAMLTYQPTKENKLYGLKIDGGFYNGTGIAVPGTTSLNGVGVVDFDSYKDFIGRIHYKKSYKQDKINVGMGISHYNGGFVYQSNKVYYSLSNHSDGITYWQLADTNSKNYKNGKAPRIYYGADLQFSIKTKLGTTTLRGEYISGTQTGTMDETKSPSSLPTKLEAVIRKFNGGYAYLIHRIGQSKNEFVAKYEWYDPNIKITGNALVGINGMTKAELKYTMLGLGYNYYLNENVKFMVYYNMVANELAKGLSDYLRDIKDNVLTIRMQVRF